MSLKLNERYPGRYNNPSADYPLGSFKNRTAPGAKNGSYLEQDWANDKEGFFQSLLSLAGITPNGSVDKVGASQFFDALQKLKQSQSGTAFPTTGPSAALVLTPAPAITAYAAGQRFRVKFNRASTGADTINISGKGAISLKQYDSAGAKVAAVFAIEQLADIEYDGVDVVLLDQLPADKAQPVNIVVISASGTYTKPAGLKYALIKVQAGGGGGGGANSTPANQANSASGGGGGGYAESMFPSASIAASVSVVVGAGGAGGVLTGGNGQAGGASSFGSLVTAAGGAGGTGITTATGGSIRGQGGAGAGGTAVGVIVRVGGNGGIGVVATTTSFGGAGGGSAFSPQTNGAIEGLVGPSASTYGGGGAGAAEGGSPVITSGRMGGAGKAGVVIIEEYF